MPRVSKGTRVNKNTKALTIPPKFKSGFLSTMDKRTELFKALRNRRDEIVNDLGGPTEIGNVKRALIERFCWLVAMLEHLEAQTALGAIDLNEAAGKIFQGINAMKGVASLLGVDRKPEKPWVFPADMTDEESDNED